MHHSQYFFTPIGIFPYACALFGRPFPVSPMVCLALPHTPLPRKQMSPAPYVTALKTAGFGRTGVERAQLPNIISFASNKTRELRAKNLRLFDKTRGLSKSGGGLIHKMVDYQNEYGVVKKINHKHQTLYPELMNFICFILSLYIQLNPLIHLFPNESIDYIK